VSTDLHGIWAFPEKGYEGLLDIAANGRIVQFIRQSENSTKLIPMKLWYSNEGTDRFRIRSMPRVEGYVITMHREGEELIIQHPKKELRVAKSILTKCHSGLMRNLSKRTRL
jgi:hypothetical protein